MSSEHNPIRILDIDVKEVGSPRPDTPSGGGLYAVPFRLSAKPSALWEKAFLKAWALPPEFTSMHRPGIAIVSGDRIILDGTTIEEIQRYHLKTLKLCVAEANAFVETSAKHARDRESAEKRKRRSHVQHVEKIARALNFD